MKIKEIITIIKENVIFISVVVILFALLAYLSTSFKKPGYTQDRTVFLKIQQSTSSDRLPDIQALTDTAVAILSSRDFQNSTGAPAAVSVKKIAPQVISISSSAQTGQMASQAVEKTITEFNNVSSNLINYSPVLQSIGSQPEPGKALLNNKVLTVFGALVGFIIALSTITISRYLRL